MTLNRGWLAMRRWMGYYELQICGRMETEMTDLGIFTTDYREHRLTADFMQSPQGIVIGLKAGPLPWRHFDDTLYPTYEEAKSAAVAEGRRLIDQLVG